MAGQPSADDPRGRSRRNFLAASAGLATLSGAATAQAESASRASAAGPIPRAPFDSIRDYVAALEARGMLLRIPEIDQDEYLSTALMFRVVDRFGMFGAPGLLFENMKIDGEWRPGPVVANLQGHWNADCIVFGLEPVPGDWFASYRRAKSYLAAMLEAHGGRYPSIPPVEIERDQAPCKEVVLTGDEIDLLKFPFMKTNPADAGRYLNTGSVFTADAELGNNFGTYRCQITGPRTMKIHSSNVHVGYKTWMAARERGEQTAPVSVVVGQDPVVWALSGSPIARQRDTTGPVDELAMAGGMRGLALSVVKSDTNDLIVPAHAEMVVEGEMLLQAPLVQEGPFGEMFGYLGPVMDDVFTMRVTRVTHRRNPWIMNSFTGMHRGFVTAPMEALYDNLLRKMVPNLVEFHYPQNMMGVAFLSIDKTEPGQGLDAGRKIAQRIPIVKLVVVVDKEMNVLDPVNMLFTIGSRWQPHPATEIIEDARGISADPSAPVNWRTSKAVIDATRQWPEEGGPASYPELNRVLLERGAPDAFERMDQQFGDLLDGWQRI